jgi:predicted RNase H-like nuclease (RuvC/YqgF family)
MVKRNLKRHMSPNEISATADWIMDQSDLPSWNEVRAFVLREFCIDRTVEALRRIKPLKTARKSRAQAPKKRNSPGARPTTRKINALHKHIDRLEAEVLRLREENQELFERNLRLINGARVHQILERDLDRPLAPINRNPTNLHG